MLFTYCYLNLPTIPESILESAYRQLAQCESNVGGSQHKMAADTRTVPGYREYLTRTITDGSGKKFRAPGHRRYRLDDEFDRWVGRHLEQNTDTSGIAIFDDFATSYPPHVDATRSYTLIYLLEAGGDCVETVWWRQPGFPIVREDLRCNFDPKDIISDYNQVVEVDRVQVPLKKWICVNSAILHSIENITSPRIAIQISRDDLPNHIIDHDNISLVVDRP